MILDERGKKYLLKEDCEFQSDLGIVTKEQIANCEIGDELKSHLDHTFKIVKPTVNDFIDLMDRRCSILVKKDIGTVLAYTGLGSGAVSYTHLDVYKRQVKFKSCFPAGV